MEADDPWDWSIDRVVRELCTPNRTWTPRSANSPVPDPTILEAALRENAVDGAVLLCDVTNAALIDIGIHKLSWRSFVNHAVITLRRQSAKYDAYQQEFQQTSVRDDVRSAIQESLEDHFFRNGHGAQQPLGLDRQIENRNSGHLQGTSVDEHSSKRRRLDSANPESSNIEATSEHQEQFSQNQSGILTPVADPPPGPTPDGKKRKRIAPTLVTSEIDFNRNRDIPTGADDVILNNPDNIAEPGVLFTDDSGQKRMVPIHVTDANSGELTRLENLRQPSFVPQLGSSSSGISPNDTDFQQVSSANSQPLMSGYLGRKALPVDQLFYENIDVGQELGPLSNESDFYVSSQISSGRRRYVHNMMKTFQLAQRHVFQRDGKYFSAIRPYHERFAPKYQKPSMTLYFSTPDGNIHARRENTGHWPEFGASDSNNSQSASDARGTTFQPVGPDMLAGLGSYDDWDPSYLEKYRNLEGGDEVLPLYGESDEENEYDLATWKEMEEEQGGSIDRPLKPTRRSHLSLEQIEQAIDEGIDQLVTKWKLKVLPKRQQRAWSLWVKSRKRGTKRTQITTAQAEREHIVQRMEKLRKEIATEIWTSPLAVHKQTRIMETNVFTREDLAWTIGVLEQKRPPAKSAQLPSPKGSRKSVHMSEDGEEGESIESDNSDSSSEDGLDDFVVSDEDMPILEEDPEPNLADSEDETEDVLEYENNQVAVGLGTGSASSSPEPLERSNIVGTPSKKSKQTMSSSSLSTPQSFSTPKRERITPRSADNGNALPSFASVKSKDNTMLIDLTMTSSDDAPNTGSTVYGSRTTSTQIIDLITPTKKQPIIKLKPSKYFLDHMAIDTTDEDDIHGVAKEELAPYTDPAAIALYSWNALEARPDRERLVIKDVCSMTENEKVLIFEFILDLIEDRLWHYICQLIRSRTGENPNIEQLDPATVEATTAITRLFQIYSVGRRERVWPSIHTPTIDSLKNILKNQALFPPFFKLCCELESYFLTEPDSTSVGTPTRQIREEDNEGIIDQEDVDDDEEDPQPTKRRRVRANSSSDDETPEPESPTKKKKAIVENVDAKNMREQAQARRAQQDVRRKQLQKNKEQGVDIGDQAKILINDAALETQAFHYVNERIAQDIKPHQVEGLRFLWNQTITEDKVLQGCLLAHTMGLGKTMQVISLLVAIAEASASDDPRLSSQVPERLQRSRTLILCPPTLIDNWMDELFTWVEPPDLLGELWKVDSTLSLPNRLRTIADWDGDNGGVLVMGYEMFRNLIANQPTKKRPAPLSLEEHEIVRKQLLIRPNIIIGDEAHKMKNATAGITKAAAGFDTKCRIALTGSPLANNIEEYHTMVEWVAPNYLGPVGEFRKKYVEPIQDGLFQDSLPSEKRRALKMLGVLNKDLSPKVHRADMSVLKDDLPPKREFTIIVPLTELQKEAYTLYVRHMVANNMSFTKDGEVEATTLWTWLAVLSLLCNHPICFHTKINAPPVVNRKKPLESVPSSVDATDLDDALEIDPFTSEAGVAVPKGLITAENDLFQRSVDDIHSNNLSNKVRLLSQILDAARDAKDKTLIFSQSIPTLDFLENLCRKQGRVYDRLDGKTKMELRQKKTKAFNDVNSRTEIFLISTNAGGLGLNLPGANRVVIFDFKYNPIQEEQAIGRAYRIGQKKMTFVYRFVVGGTFEDSVHNKQIFKQQLASRVVDKKSPLAKAKKKLGEFLFEPKEVEQTDLSEFYGLDPLVLDKILVSEEGSGVIRAIVQSDSFERDDDDKLTAEEEKEVQQLFNDEQLKRSDPVAYALKEQARVDREREARNRAHSMAAQHQARTLQQAQAARFGTPWSGGSVPAQYFVKPPAPMQQFDPNNLPLRGPAIYRHPEPSSHQVYSESPVVNPVPTPPPVALNVGRDIIPVAESNTRVRTPSPRSTAKLHHNSNPRGSVNPTTKFPGPSRFRSSTRARPSPGGLSAPKHPPKRSVVESPILPPSRQHAGPNRSTPGTPTKTTSQRHKDSEPIPPKHDRKSSGGSSQIRPSGTRHANGRSSTKISTNRRPDPDTLERRGSSSSVDVDDKNSDMFNAMNRQPVQSLKTPVMNHPKRRHRKSGMTNTPTLSKPSNKNPMVPNWAADQIDKAQASAKRRHQSGTPSSTPSRTFDARQPQPRRP